MGLFFWTPGHFFQESSAIFWTPRHFFSGVMGYIFGLLGKKNQESWAIFLDLGFPKIHMAARGGGRTDGRADGQTRMNAAALAMHLIPGCDGRGVKSASESLSGAGAASAGGV